MAVLVISALYLPGFTQMIKKINWVGIDVISEIEIKFFYQTYERFFSGCKCPSAIY